MAHTFTTIIKQAGKTAAGIQVPDEIVAALGQGRNPKVLVTLNGGYSYRGTVQVSNGAFMISLSGEKREAAGIKGGDEVEVTLEADVEPRTVDVPADLSAALTEAGVLTKFEGLAYSRRKEFARQVNDAKTEETRSRRIAKIVAELGNA